MADAPGPARHRLWRPPTGAAPGEPPPARAPERRRQIFVALALLLGLGGATLAWLLFPSPVALPAFVGIWIDQYDDEHIPPHPYTAQDRAAFEGVLRDRVNAFTHQQSHLLRKLLHELRDRTDRPLVVYLSAHAAVRPDGTACLLPGDARLDDDTTWIPLVDVFRALRECKAPHRLLVLDLMRPFAEPRFGVLGGEVPEAAQRAIVAALKDDPGLHTLWACGPGQTSHVSEELGRSALVHYLVEGLRGRADGWGEAGRGARDGRVSARELARFVCARVDRWSQANRVVRQTPQYAGPSSDFDLAAVEDHPPTAPAAPAPAAYPEWLAKQWQRRDAWWAEPAWRVPPEILERLDALLLRAESGLHAGMSNDEVRRGVDKGLTEIERKHAAWVESRPDALPRSLAREAARGRKPPDLRSPEAVKYRAVVDLAQRILAAPKPDEKDRERLEAERAALLKLYEGKPFDLAWTAFEELAGQLQPARERFRFVRQILADAGAPPYRETSLVDRLAGWDVRGREWPGVTARVALEVTRLGERTEAAAEAPGVRPWVLKSLSAAAERRQAAEALTLAPRDATDGEVLAAWEAARDACRAAAEEVDAVARARRVYDDAEVRLPTYPAAVEAEPRDEDRWAAAVASARALKAALRAGRAEGAARKLGNLADTLRAELTGGLQGRAESRAEDLIRRSDRATPAEWQSMSALLETPWLDAGRRAALWAAARRAAAEMNFKALRKDHDDDVEHRQAAAPAPPDPREAQAQRSAALLRARMSLALLTWRAGDDAELKAAHAALARTAQSPEDPAAWGELRSGLRGAWTAAPKP